jgi:hypothetical protein
MPEMIPLPLDRYSFLGDDWDVDEHGFTSRLVEGRPEQLLIFADRPRNGSICADITVLDSSGPDTGGPPTKAPS